MKIEAFKINGEIYLSSEYYKRAEVKFWLPLRQIQCLIQKSEGFNLTVGKGIELMTTNAGMQKCKLVSFSNVPRIVQNWMDKVGMDFSEKVDNRTIHAPYKIGESHGHGFNRIDFYNAFFSVTKNKKSGNWQRNLFFSKDRTRTIEKTYYGFIQPAY